MATFTVPGAKCLVSLSLSFSLARSSTAPPPPPQVVIGILRNRYEVAKVKHVTFSSATSCDKVPHIVLSFIFRHHLRIPRQSVREGKPR
jgi:hypothetical protein